MRSRASSCDTGRMEVADLFSGNPVALSLYREVEAAIMAIGPTQVKASKSQVGFYREHPFAATWTTGQYLGREAAPLVLSVYLKRRDNSSRWKEVIEAAPGRFTHHIELHSAREIDEFVRARLAEAWEVAA